MFGSRLLVNMACRSMYKPVFKINKSFATMSQVYIETTSLLNKSIDLPTNLLVRNLRQMVLRAEQDAEVEMDINGASQLSLLIQGNNILISTKHSSNFVNKAGLIKLPC